jgi:L-cysteine S-thiosulfotransferase
MVKKTLAAASILAAGLCLSLTVNAQMPSDADLQKYVDGMFGKSSAEWQSRVRQDETQRLCSRYRNEPPAEEADMILAREGASIVFPADGGVMGNWQAGEEVAQNGRGGQFSDEPGAVNGGNCYACHRLAPNEVSYGTLGPSLLAYGKLRGFQPDEAKAAYAKIYDAQAVTACSQMPRFGYHKVLTEQQMKDVTAYLFDPQSPVNK